MDALPKTIRLKALDSWLVQSRPEQKPPDTNDWRTWLLLGGRGAGKTRAGAEWLAAGAEKGARFALVGPSLHDVREVMIEGPSGLRAVSAPDNKPRYEVSRRRLIWPQGGVAYAHSAEDRKACAAPSSTAHGATSSAPGPAREETLALLRMAVRRGSDPRLVVTTTPKPTPALRGLMAEPGVVTHRMPTAQNAQNLSPAFLENLLSVYGGTSLAAQELEGLVIDDRDGALWKAAALARCRGSRPPGLDRIVVAVDPPITQTGDACGIIVAGRLGRMAFVLDDRSERGLSPDGWARKVAKTVADFGAAHVVAEVNQGGDMVRATLAAAECRVAIRTVRARVGKRARAEPVAALYEQGRVVHCGAFPMLEEEMMALGSDALSHSPDRADALVWALTDLLLGEPGARRDCGNCNAVTPAISILKRRSFMPLNRRSRSARPLVLGRTAGAEGRQDPAPDRPGHRRPSAVDGANLCRSEPRRVRQEPGGLSLHPHDRRSRRQRAAGGFRRRRPRQPTTRFRP